MGVNQFLQRKALEASVKIQDFLDNGLNSTTVKQDSKLVRYLTKLRGKKVMRKAVMEGFAKKDFPDIVNKNPGITLTEMLKPYRDEPEFHKVIKKLKIDWAEIETLAKEAGAICDTTAQ